MYQNKNMEKNLLTSSIEKVMIIRSQWLFKNCRSEFKVKNNLREVSNCRSAWDGSLKSKILEVGKVKNLLEKFSCKMSSWKVEIWILIFLLLMTYLVGRAPRPLQKVFKNTSGCFIQMFYNYAWNNKRREKQPNSWYIWCTLHVRFAILSSFMEKEASSLL